MEVIYGLTVTVSIFFILFFILLAANSDYYVSDDPHMTQAIFSRKKLEIKRVKTESQTQCEVSAVLMK